MQDEILFLSTLSAHSQSRPSTRIFSIIADAFRMSMPPSPVNSTVSGDGRAAAFVPEWLLVSVSDFEGGDKFSQFWLCGHAVSVKVIFPAESVHLLIEKADVGIARISNAAIFSFVIEVT